MSLRLPPSIQSIIGPGGRIDPHWERWLGELVRQINTPVQTDDEVTPVDPPALVQGYGIAVTGAGTQDSPWVVGLREIADSGAGALLGITRDAYGRITGTVDATITGTAGEIDVANGDAAAGVPTLSLADVTPTTGGTLKKYGFDAKGRRDKQGDATTDDLTEGTTNLYFTDARAYAAAKSILAAGSNVTITPDDGAQTLTIAASGGGGGAMALVGTAEVAGSAATVLTMTDLDLSADGRYLVEVALKNAIGSAVNVYLDYNGDTSSANYHVQFAYAASGSSNAPSRQASGLIDAMFANSTSTGDIAIANDQDGRPRSHFRFSRNSSSAPEVIGGTHVWHSATNVTSISIRAGTANALAVGSYIRVWKIG